MISEVFANLRDSVILRFPSLAGLGQAGGPQKQGRTPPSLDTQRDATRSCSCSSLQAWPGERGLVSHGKVLNSPCPSPAHRDAVLGSRDLHWREVAALFSPSAAKVHSTRWCWTGLFFPRASSRRQGKRWPTPTATPGCPAPAARRPGRGSRQGPPRGAPAGAAALSAWHIRVLACGHACAAARGARAILPALGTSFPSPLN